jgi:hypothetical protein
MQMCTGLHFDRASCALSKSQKRRFWRLPDARATASGHLFLYLGPAEFLQAVELENASDQGLYYIRF